MKQNMKSSNPVKEAFRKVKEDNLFLLQKIEVLEERLKAQERQSKEMFELLREQIELYKAETMMSSNPMNNEYDNYNFNTTAKKKKTTAKKSSKKE